MMTVLRGRFAARCTAIGAVLALTLSTGIEPGLAAGHTAIGTVGSLSPTDIDLSTTGVVKIHTATPNPYDDPAAVGVPKPTNPRTLILQRFPSIAINTVEGFREAENFTLEKASKLPTTDVRTTVTDSSGNAEYKDLVPGLYILSEKQPDLPEADRDREYYTMVPVLFTLPVGEDGTSWSYNLQLETKDQLVGGKHPQPEPGSSGSTAGLGFLIPLLVGGIAVGSFSSGPELPPVVPTSSPAPSPTPTAAPPSKGIPKGTPKTTAAPKPSALEKLARTGANAAPVWLGGFGALGGGVLLLILMAWGRRRR